MTTKPMLSVDRELLERILDSIGFGEREELRAILDKPDTPYTPKGAWSFERIDGGDIVIRNGKAWTLIKRGDGPIYEQFLYRFCEEQMKTADQHHGTPVAWAECSPAWLKAGGDCATAPRLCVGRGGISHLHPAHAGQPAPVAVNITDEQILEAMRLSITAADGGYVYDMSPEYVIAAGRSLLEVASLLDIKQSPVAVVMLEKLIEAIGVEQDRLFQDAERMTVEDCVKVIQQELEKLNGVNK